MGYDAFISYSHAADSQLAPRLQDGLQRLAKPWWRRRSLHVFRDDTGLSANPGLWSSIESALEDSGWFVFLASDEAAESVWVERELSHWIDRHGPDRILPVVTGGTWVWDVKRNDFDMDASSAVPSVLAGVFAEEPRHVDMTWARSEEQVDLRNARFRDQVAEIAAPIHGMAKDDLEGVDVREHRRTLRWTWGAAAALLLLTVLSVLGGALAVRNAQEAAAQRDEASMQRISAEKSATKAAKSATEADSQRSTAESERKKAKVSEADALDAQATAETQADRAKRNEQAARAAESVTAEARDAEEAASNKAKANALRAETNADEAKSNQKRAEKNAAEAAASAAEALKQEGLAKSNAQTALMRAEEAKLERKDAEASRQAAVASQRNTELALASKEQALAAETAAKTEAKRSATQAEDSATRARAAQERAEVDQVKAEKAAAAERSAKEAETAARRSAETEALASSSAASKGGLSLLLGVEAARRGASDTGGIAGLLNVFTGGSNTRQGSVASGSNPATDSTTGRRALFEAVAAAQGGADSYRVDRFLPFPADLADAPVSLWRPVVSQDGRYLAAAEFPDLYRASRGPVPTRVFLWDLQSPTPAVKVLSGHQEQVTVLAFAGNGATLVTQDLPYDLETTAPITRVWDVTAGRQLLERQAVMFIDPTARHIALQSWPSQVEFVDGTTGAVTSVQPGVMAVDFGVHDTEGTGYQETPFSSDGTYAYGHSGGRAVLWDLRTGGTVTVPLASPTTTWSSTPRVSPDGSGLAAAVENGTDLAFFDAATGTPLASIPMTTGSIVSLNWNPDGTRLAIVDDLGRLLMLDNDGDDNNNSWAATVPQGGVGFDRTGRFVTVTVQSSTSLTSFDTVLLNLGDGSPVGSFDGQLVASRASGMSDLFFLRDDSTLAVIDSSTGRVTQADDTGDKSSTVAVSSDGDHLAVSSTSGVRIWNLNSGAPAVRTAKASSLVLGLSYVAGSERLVGTGFGADPIIWDLERVGAGSRVGSASPDATVLSDGTTLLEPINGGSAVRFRNMVTGATRPGPALEQGESVDYAVAGPQDGPLVVNLTNGTALVARVDGSTVGRITGTVATMSRDGSRLAVRAPARSITIIDTADLSTLRNISLDALADDDIAFQFDSVTLSADGSLLAATNGTGDMVVWDVVTGEVVTTIPGRSSDRISFPLWGLAFSPDGGRLVVKGPSNTVRMYAVNSGDTWQLVATQALPNEFAGRVVFSPDGTLIAIDGLFLLDGSTLRPVATLLAGPGSVTRFTSDGRYLVTIAANGSEGPNDLREVVRWTVSTDDLTTEACRIAGRDLTRDEWNRYLGGSGQTYRRTCG